MKTQLVFATGNANKMKEIREILGGLDVDILSIKEADIELNDKSKSSSKKDGCNRFGR